MEQSIITAISTVGFPIVACLGLAFALWQMWKKMSNTLDVVTETNRNLVSMMDVKVVKIETKVDNIGDKLDKYLD